MTEALVLAELFRLTATLWPISPATVEDLETLRRRIAASLFHLPGDGVSPFVPSDEELRARVLELKAIVLEVGQQHAAGTGPPRSRVVRRELPLHSAFQPEPFPARSGAHAITRTFGPMLEDDERVVSFDLYESAPFVRFVRGPGDPFLLLPPETQSEDEQTFTFGAGSVWIQSRLLVPSAGGWNGVRVAEGSLAFRAPVGEVSGATPVPPDAVGTLSLILEPPFADDSVQSPGADAANSFATRPREVTLELTSGGVQRIDADVAGFGLYGLDIGLTRNDEPPVVSDLAEGVLVPFSPSVDEVMPEDVRSTLLQPGGTWSIAQAGWLLPSSLFPDPADLGAVAESGALALVVEPGLEARWRGLEGGPFRAERAMLLSDSRELSLVAVGRTARIARQELALWGTGPRTSTLELLFRDPFRLHFVSSRQGVDALSLTSTAVARLDQPLQADGKRARLRFEDASVTFWQDDDAEMVLVAGRRSVSPRKVVPLALPNALLKTTQAEELTVRAFLDADGHATGVTITLVYGLHAVLPFLPDPYAVNVEPPREPVGSRPPARLTAVLRRATPDAAALRLSLTPVAEGIDLATALLPRGRDLLTVDDHDLVLRSLFEHTVHREHPRRHPPLILLDVSGNADQLGVATAFPNPTPRRRLLSIDAVGQMTASANDLRVVALPQVQWEPLRTHPDDLRPGFPQPFRARDDGGPLLFGVAPETVQLVPVAPEPLLGWLLHLSAQPGSATAIRFTLPFGIKAVATSGMDRRAMTARPTLALNQPAFDGLTGALQFSLTAGTPAGIPGGAIQTRNSTSQPPKSVLDDVVDGFFNSAFHPDSPGRRVPLSRIDFSGYGASASSKWVNENASPVDITKVEFDVLVGRTSYEVVEIQSILWPCMARVVRRITIRREGNGAVLRRDSGWVAATPGVFHRPDSSCVFHPGVVWGMFNIREIRDTPRRVRVTPNVPLQAVYFDCDLAVENAVRGHAFEGEGPHGQRFRFVPSQRQLGFVQLIDLDSLQKTPLTPQQLAELLAAEAPVGGPVDCEVDIGRSDQRMRVGSVYADIVVEPAGGDPQFAVAAFGVPELPREGQWSVVRLRSLPVDSPEPEPVDPRLGVPLVRAGVASAPPSVASPHRLADPVDLLRPSAPETDYALLLATQTFRVLFRRPKIELGSRRITSDLPPMLADAHALLQATGSFPRLKHAIPFASSAYELRILGGGRLRLSPSPLTHTVPQPRVLEVAKAAGVHAFTEYRGGDRHHTGAARIELRFDSAGDPSWALKIGPISTVADIDPFGKVMRLITTLEADSASRPRATAPLMEYGGALSAVEDLITVMKEFGIPGELLVETPNSAEHVSTKKMKYALKLKLPKVEILGKVEGELHVGAEFGTKRPKYAPPPLPTIDALGSAELFVEVEGEVQLPIIKPIYGGGFIRLEFKAGYDPSKQDPVISEIKLTAGVVGSIGGNLIPHLLKVEGEVRYGYVVVVDIARGEFHPGLMVGLGLEVEIEHIIKIAFEAEVVALVKRVSEDEIKVHAEFTIAGEVELFDLVDIEYSVETEWDVDLPMVAVAALAIAIGVGAVPLVPP